MAFFRCTPLAFVALGVSSCAGEPRVLPPRTPPERQVPNVALPQRAPAGGEGRVVLDTTDGPMRVTVQSDPTFVPTGFDRPPSRVGELCITPCVADLPVGRYRLFLSSTTAEATGDTDDLTLGAGLTVYRRAPGKYETPSFSNALPPALLLSVSVLAVSLGTMFGSLAIATGDSRAATGSLIVAGLGVAGCIGGGIWLYDARRAIQQNGATTTWQEATP